MFIYYGREYVQIAKLYGQDEEADFISNEIKKMEANVIKHGWDGEWFLRAYDAFERKIGSKECKEGKFSLSLRLLHMARIGENLGLGKSP